MNLFLKKLPTKSIDLCIADPPYNQAIDEWDVFENEDEYFKFMKRWLNLLLKRMKDNGSIYLFNNQYNSAKILIVGKTIVRKLNTNRMDKKVFSLEDLRAIAN